MEVNKQKPDFEKVANYTVDDGFTVKPYYILNEAFVAGCEYAWNTYVLHLQSRIDELEKENTELKNYIQTLG
jgi:hypothetical protein